MTPDEQEEQLREAEYMVQYWEKEVKRRNQDLNAYARALGVSEANQKLLKWQMEVSRLNPWGEAAGETSEEQ